MPQQLKMIWPKNENVPGCDLSARYELRHYQDCDRRGVIDLLNQGELGIWDEARLKKSILDNPSVPQGLFLVTYEKQPVAIAGAFDRTEPDGEKTGELGWVMVHKAHRGHALAKVVCARAVSFFLENGYVNIYLWTDFWRKAAVKTYINMGFEPVIESAEARFLWGELQEHLHIPSNRMKKRKAHIPGEEIAYRTLMGERVGKPCLLSPWCMKRSFFETLNHTDNIYDDAVGNGIRAFIRVGANLCPQFIVPGPDMEHRAADPYRIDQYLKNPRKVSAETTFDSPEQVKEQVEKMPDPDTLEKQYDFDAQIKTYVDEVRIPMEAARGEVLFIKHFGQADFMGGYTRWGYNNYMMAIGLYPEVMKRYFDYTGEQARLYNIAAAEAIKRYQLAPFVYGGQDICFNDGPIISVDDLQTLYFPALQEAVQPLHDAGIKIIWHCDGDVRPIAPILLDQIAVSGFQGFQEETGCTLEHMASLRTKQGNQPILWGSVSVTTTLPYGTVDEVKKDVERCYHTAGSTSFALGSTSSILPETPLENILAMYEHGKAYGEAFYS